MANPDWTDRQEDQDECDSRARERERDYLQALYNQISELEHENKRLKEENFELRKGLKL